MSELEGDRAIQQFLYMWIEAWRRLDDSGKSGSTTADFNARREVVDL